MTVVLVGPTAAGKSSLAAALVRRYATEGRRAEVVNADSMLVYRGMDIGTAKPSEAERAEVRHHMVDLLDVSENATVAEFQQLARGAIEDCRARDVIPIVVGGSALYVRAIVDDFEFPGTDPAVRARLERELLTHGAERLHQRLSDADPLAATRILPGNARRVVRALEVIELTGRSFSAVLPEYRYRLPDVVQIGIAIDRPTLDARIAARVDAMWAAGFVAEVRRLAASGLRDSLTASRALGYRQVLRYIDGEISAAEARDLTIVGTRKFARRQESWFRKDGRISWLPYDEPDLVSAAYALAGPAGAGSVPDSWHQYLGWKTDRMRRWSFTKGHGTENDFVLILDRESMLEVGPAEVRFICNRRAGVGADGLLRAVLAKHVDGWDGDGALWFMDYRNADGSIAEMCGNGIRVFVRYLLDQNLVSGAVVEIATRSGVKVATALPDGRIRVTMGPVVVGSGSVLVTTADGVDFKALTADVGNPHAVSFADNLDLLPLYAPPRWDPAEEFPEGVNLEFVRQLGPQHIAMRVHERGVGETHSCGTGTVAAAAATRVHDQDLTPLPVTYRVDTPGGSVEVELTEHEAYLTGPAVLVAHGELALPERAVLETQTRPALSGSPSRSSN